MKNIHGFTLIELLITLSIIAILIGIAYPAYSDYILKVHRADGQTALLQLASRMEKYALISAQGYDGVSFAKLTMNDMSPQGYYRLAIVEKNAQDFLITATAINSQARDKPCAVLALSAQGERGPAKQCW